MSDTKTQAQYQRRLAKYVKNTDVEIDDAVRELTASHKGRALLWWMLEIGRVNTQPFTGQAERTAFNCGELNVGQRVLARLTEVNPDGYLTMMKEKQNERRALSNPDPDTEPGSIPGAWDAPGAGEPDSES